MKSAPKEVLQACVNLRVSDDFKVILEWLRSNRKTARDGLEDHTDDEKFHRIQGESRCLRDILKTNDNAAQLLEKYK